MHRFKKWIIRLLLVFIIAPLAWWAFTAWQRSSTQDYADDVHIAEINRVFHPLAKLGHVTYRMNGSSGILLFSTAYEQLAENCQNRHIAELRLSETATGSLPEIKITTNSSANRYHYAHLLTGPMGSCTQSDPQEQILFEAVSAMVAQSSGR